MLALLLFIVTVEPAVVQQGQTIRVRTTDTAAASARMHDRTVRLFPNADGSRYGLMPVHALLAPGSYPLELLDSAGQALHATAITVRDGRFPVQNIRLGKAVEELRPSPGEVETMTALRDTVTEARHWDEPFTIPVPGCMTSPYGVRRLINGKSTGAFHRGVDQRAAAGQAIRAITAGTVKVARMYNIHGGTVGLDHGHGVTSAYLHMSRIAVTEGASVRKGDVVGYAGSTGRSTAPHLHWALSVNGVQVNPRQWVSMTPCRGRAILRSNGRNPRR